MSLKIKQKEIINNTLLVYPINGYGWTVNSKNIDVPNMFHICVYDFIKQITINGIRATIVERNKDDKKVILEATLRHLGNYNFSNKIGDYNIVIKKSINSENDEIITGWGFIGFEDDIINFTDRFFHKKENETEFQKQIEQFIKKYPDKKFCLHNGYAGFCYGSPSNPEFITNEQAKEYLLEYYRETKNNPIEIMENQLFTLSFFDVAPKLQEKTGYRMMGFNKKSECLFGNDGLG